MTSDSWFQKKTYEYLSQYAEKLAPQFQDVKKDLQQADMDYSLLEYLSLALGSSLMVFVVMVPMTSLVIGLLVGGLSGIIAGMIFGLFVAMFISAAVFMGFYVYPSIQVSKRRSNINHNLPFAAMYLSTVAGTGTPPAAMFRLLGNFDEYGEVSTEAENIAEDIYTFGADLDEALKNAADRTPSDKFKELLYGINSVVTTGGDLRSYMQEKTSTYMDDYRRELDQFTSILSLLVEMYITLVIVGSVLLMVLTTIMSTFGTSTIVILGIQMAATFIILPMAAIFFIILVKGTSPTD
ncbi:MAG: type II secretion system F family protein [Candidatus Nanohaloarchaea archaeon]|nr:type II secretion system F family protein [Candidatus Nanohaloarchaea archaeon]